MPHIYRAGFREAGSFPGSAQWCPLQGASRSRAGLALVEVLMGIAVITLVSASSLWALSAAKRQAITNRNFTSAEAAAQAQVDQLLSVGFPSGSPPAVLNAGTTIAPVTIVSGSPPVSGTMTTTVTLADATLDIRRFNVMVNYSYQGKNYSVSMAGARTSD
jgi:type II secretory pathway pseudopilin PulG